MPEMVLATNLWFVAFIKQITDLNRFDAYRNRIQKKQS